ncbi:MAG: hypothetical protein ABH828_02905 [archaeon]
MGIFDFLKKKKPAEEKVKFSNVNEWIQSYLENHDLNKRINSFKGQIKEKINETKALLKKLEEAGLQNENIPERAKHIMQGNRKNYIRKTNDFLEEINIPDDYLKIMDFSSALTEKIDALSKETQRSYFVLKEFMEASLSPVVRKIKEIEDITIDFKHEIEKENIHKLEEIKKKLNEFKTSEATVAALKEDLGKKESQLKELESKADLINQKLNVLQNGEGFKQYQTLKKDSETISSDIQKQKKDIIDHFSTLEKALKKYQRITLNPKLLDKYLENPAKALMEDKDLEITELLEKMLKSLKELDLKDKKEEKTKEEIKALNKEFLESLRDKLKLYIDDEKKIKQKLLSNISVMSISEQESLFDNMQRNIDEKKEEMEDINNKLDRTSPNLIKQQVKELLKEFNVIMENG